MGRCAAVIGCNSGVIGHWGEKKSGMKKASTYYFVLLTVANVFLAQANSWINGRVVATLTERYEGKSLPYLTLLFVGNSGWPYVLAGLFFIGAMISFQTRLQSEKLCHAVIILLALEAFILFCNLVAFTLPFTAPVLPHS